MFIYNESPNVADKTGREAENQITMIDTTCRQTYPEPCVFEGRFNTEPVFRR